MSASNGSPPQVNPVLSGYESFVQNTPLVTRYTLTTLSVSYLLSWFVNPSFAIANIPLFTLFNFELYRIVFSPFVCPSLITLIFAFMSFTDNAKRLELSMGSTGFAVLMLTIGMATNLIFLMFCMLCYGITGSQTWLIMSSDGIWMILMGIIAVECSKAPPEEKRKLFVVEVPTLYYPLALWALFSLFSGFRFAELISIGVGYAHGHGYLDRLKFSNATFSRWEDGFLRNFSSRQGWIVGQAATGNDAWLPINNPHRNTGPEGAAASPFSALFRGSAAQQPSGTVAAPPKVGKPKDPAAHVAPAFPRSGGQSLGGSGPSLNADRGEARTQRLRALEKRTSSAVVRDENSN